MRRTCEWFLTDKQNQFHPLTILLNNALYAFYSSSTGALSRKPDSPMNDTRATKLRRLDRFRRRVPAVTASALAAILKTVEEDGIPELYTRKAQADARRIIASSDTPYGPLIQTLTLDCPKRQTLEFPIAEPFAMLWHCFYNCSSFRRLFVQRHSQNPSSADHPWTLILYTDEVTPGNVLATITTRKLQAIYVSFLELGPAALAREDCWIALAVCRSLFVNKALGGISQLVGGILKRIYPQQGLHLEHTGLHLHHEANDFRFHARLGIVVQDGAAHRDLWKCKGDAGTRFCIGCFTLHYSSDLVSYNPNLQQHIIDDKDIEWTTDDDVIDAARRLAAFRLTDSNAEFERRQQIIGLTYSEYSLLTDPELVGVVKPSTQFMHDWMHGLFSSGVFNKILYLLLTMLESENINRVYEWLYDYLKDWRWPARVHGKGIEKIFDLKRKAGNINAKNFRCQASEGLTVYPVLAYWLTTFIMPLADLTDNLRASCDAFLAFSDVVDCFTAIARGIVSPDLLRKAIHSFLEKFIAAWGWGEFTPKMHWLLHYPKELERHETLLSCFVHERKHKVVRRYGTPVSNTKNFERTVLEEITCHHLCSLSSEDTLNFRHGLVNERQPDRETMTALLALLDVGMRDIEAIATESRFNDYETCSRSDIVFTKRQDGGLAAGEIWLHMRVQGANISIISNWVRTHLDGNSRSAEWRMTQDLQIIATSDIVATAIWLPLGSGLARTIVPSDLL